MYNNALSFAANDSNTDWSTQFDAYKQGVSEDQWNKDYLLGQASLKAQKDANDKSDYIAALEAKIEALEGTDFSKFTKDQWIDYFGGIKSSKGADAAQQELNDLIKKGVVPKDVVSVVSASVNSWR